MPEVPVEYSAAVTGMGQNAEELRAEVEVLKAQLEDAQYRLSVRSDPGTPLAIVEAMFEYAERECGHSRYSARHALTSIDAYIQALKAQQARLAKRVWEYLDYWRDNASDALGVVAAKDRLRDALRDPFVASALQWLAEREQAARAEGMEEAAKIADSHVEHGEFWHGGRHDCEEAIASEIRKAAAIRRPEVTR